MRGAAVGLAVLAWLTAAPVQAASVEFEDWVAVCDNTRSCTAFGFSPEPGDISAFLRIERGGATDAPVRALLAGYGDKAETWRVEVDGALVPGLGPVRGEGDARNDNLRAVLGPEPSRRLLAAIRDGGKLTLTGGAAPRAVSLVGGAAAMRWIDAQQKRVDTTTALIAVGPKSAGAVPPPPAAPLVRAAPAVSQARLPARLPAGIRGLRDDCDEHIDPKRVGVHRLSPGVLLWVVPCSAGAYNLMSDLWRTDERGANPRPLNVSVGDETRSALVNVRFDPKTQTLSQFSKARGVGDCGATGTWAWDGQAMRTTRRAAMPFCRQLLPEDWPADYVSRSR